MEITAILVAFISIMILITKKVNMGLSLLIGAFILALLLPFSLTEALRILFKGITSPLSVELMILVGFIGGLGYIMKETRDMELMIDSLIAIFKNATLLSMLLPTLIGTINVPGGAILSAPMVKESGDELKLSPVKQAAVNIFFRHIGYFIYPLYSSLIIATQLLNLEKTVVIKYNVSIMLAGLICAFFLFFRGVKRKKKIVRENNGFLPSLLSFFLGFFPILIILVLALGFKVSFSIAVITGVVVAILKNPGRDPRSVYKKRVVGFFTKGVNYQFLFVILGVISFKSIIEESGALFSLAEIMLSLGISLPVMIILLGFVTSFIIGVHMAATGILVPMLAPLLLPHSIGPYVSLLFSAIILGYILSPLHLCLVLSKEYYQVELIPIYKLLALPVGVMLLTGFIQVLILT